MIDQLNLPELVIHDLRLWVKLGYSVEERKNIQPISVTAHFKFFDLPGVHTDKMADTLCYGRAVELVQDLVHTEEFRLIEYLTARIYDVLHSYAGECGHGDSQIRVVVTKLSPPVVGLCGGVSFSYSGTARGERN